MIDHKEVNRNFLKSGSFLILNKTLIRNIGLIPAIFITDLVDRESYLEKNNKLEDNNLFYYKQSNRKKYLGLNTYVQSETIKELIELELIEVSRMGLPAKQYFKLNHRNIFLVASSSISNNLLPDIEPNIYNKNKDNKTKDRLLKETNNLMNDSENHLGDNRTFKRTKFPKTKNPIPKKKESSFVEYFNKLSRITKHKAGSKAYNTAHLKCQRLLKGTFLKDKEFNPEFIKRHNIKLTARKFTKEEILKGLDNLSEFLREGCWGYKKIRDRGLNNMLYNPYTKTSLFLMVIYNPSVLELVTKKIKNPYPNEVNLLMPIICSNGNSLSDKEQMILISGLTSIRNFHLKISKAFDPRIKFKIGTLFKLCREFVDWIEYQDWLKGDIDVKSINTGSKLWNKFITNLEEELGEELK